MSNEPKERADQLFDAALAQVKGDHREAAFQVIKFHTDESAQLRGVCEDQAVQIADLRAALSGTDYPRAVPPQHRWRVEPPTSDEVTEYQWWWNKQVGGVPLILQLDRDPGSGLVFDAGESTSGACAPPFDPSDWPGAWAPCMTPEAVTSRVSRIAAAGKRLVMSHVGKVKALRSQLALTTVALEQAWQAPVALAEARQLAASADSAREAFEAGFAIGLERGRDTAQGPAEVTDATVREDLAVLDRAFRGHMTGLAEREPELRGDGTCPSG